MITENIKTTCLFVSIGLIFIVFAYVIGLEHDRITALELAYEAEQAEISIGFPITFKSGDYEVKTDEPPLDEYGITWGQPYETGQILEIDGVQFIWLDGKWQSWERVMRADEEVTIWTSETKGDYYKVTCEPKLFTNEAGTLIYGFEEHCEYEKTECNK